MRLQIEWVKASRGGADRVRFETTARDAILERCNGVENAYKCHQRYLAGDYRDPLSDWARFVREAVAAASQPLSPSERLRIGILAHFIP